MVSAGVVIGVGLNRAALWWERRPKDTDQQDDDKRRGLGPQAQELQKHLLETQKPARILGIRVDQYNTTTSGSTSLVLSAPLSLNTNVHGAAFCGSLYSVSTLCCYYLVHVWMNASDQKDSQQLDGYVLVVKSARIQYKKPVIGCDRIVGYGTLPEADAMQRFRDALVKKRKAYLDMTAEIRIGPEVVASECAVQLCAYQPAPA